MKTFLESWDQIPDRFRKHLVRTTAFEDVPCCRPADMCSIGGGFKTSMTMDDSHSISGGNFRCGVCGKWWLRMGDGEFVSCRPLRSCEHLPLDVAEMVDLMRFAEG